jgi:hypothetical protein
MHYRWNGRPFHYAQCIKRTSPMEEGVFRRPCCKPVFLRLTGTAEIGARIGKPFKEPRNRFPAWQTGATTLFVVPARQATQAGEIETFTSTVSG